MMIIEQCQTKSVYRMSQIFQLVNKMQSTDNITSECKALWGEPEHRYTCIYGLRKRHMILIRAHSYVTAADGPVCHLQFHWPLCFCYKHADS